MVILDDTEPCDDRIVSGSDGFELSLGHFIEHLKGIISSTMKSKRTDQDIRFEGEMRELQKVVVRDMDSFDILQTASCGLEPWDADTRKLDSPIKERFTIDCKRLVGKIEYA
ncbi:hypothetical protein Ccrd_019334 [Cynara cardunculus var. scolymus]|uniref:Uncharacterized protein n=1 Tax=Cynara cardunculus var. scolymus TaxID=59895 RepID=A0A103Y4I3_CYNCS|nr:hypothetical protein Ccrd_019334 [Cynara cardunculus var. scolymus]